ncbi:methyltransferase [Mucilaginibacter robiniae]|uniref:tRNA1(Val) (adenine(37)-N6)-methyltransferase n=1 Tax=Mucilaginibacter robiniae TaxID=2728022 RepID=A0A7L5E5J4_9SPHI|nr:methyltransferase [Mucilaginibacter robiniae]QJD97657.1 methyltransferase [Mucilaginibacter robiniae]
MPEIFQFKQFSVDQTGCAMKINTDGVLLGAMAETISNAEILDIGTGTGVIALMLAQRFIQASITGVEMDESAAQTATTNLRHSPYTDRLQLAPVSFQEYFTKFPDKQYDLIVSNPPFYIQSLHSPAEAKTLAKHAGNSFFHQLIQQCSLHLKPKGTLWLILPLQTSALVKDLVQQCGLHLQQIINIGSYPHSAAHREILVIGAEAIELLNTRFIIYDAPKQYSNQYKQLLQSFFTIF